MRRPIVWFVCAWMSGMAVAACYGWTWIVLGGIAAGCAGGAVEGSKTGCVTGIVSEGRRVILAAVIAAVAFMAGGSWYERYDMRNVTAFPPEIKEETLVTIHGIINTQPKAEGDRIVFDLKAQSVTWEGRTQELSNEIVKVFVRFKTEADKQQGVWQRGYGAVAVGTLREPLPATNFDGFDYRLYLRRHHTFRTLATEGAASIRTLPSDRTSVLYAVSKVDQLRNDMSKRVNILFSESVSGFMNGLLLGLRDGLEPEQYRAFSQVGLTHILAISGLHVAIYVGAVLWLLGRLPLARETRLVLAMAAVPAYVILTGASPSVVRAGFMAMIALYAARRQLLKDGLHVLAAAAFLMTAYHPFYIHDISFQLSFAVTAGLIIGVPMVNTLHYTKYTALQSAVSVTLVAQLVSFPLTLTYFNAYSLLSFPANLIMVPLFSFAVLPLGSIALLLSYVFPPGASLAAYGAEWLTIVSFIAVERLNTVEGASTIWATPPLWWVGAYYAVLYMALAFASRRIRLPCPPSCAILALLAAWLGLLIYAYDPDRFDRSAYVSLLDVGQGDAIWIRTPYGKQVLIDGGGTLYFDKPGEEWKRRNDPFEVGEDLVVPLLKRRGVHRVDAIFATHADTDHIGGLPAVLEQIPVGRLLFNGTVKPSESSEALFRLAVKKGIPLTPLYTGMTFRLDPATTVRVLYPSRMEGLPVEEEQNEFSIVFLLTIFDRNFLFTGDIGAAEEKAIVEAIRRGSTEAEGALPRIDVMKIAHHGSKSSTTEEWLSLWKPNIAVISVGRRNIYGHPHPTITERLNDSGVITHRTDTEGEVQFRIMPESFHMRTKLNTNH
jgi:competence protein ComEC